MNNKFDELTKSLAQSVTRRAALKKFGVGLAGMALACFGLANSSRAATRSGYCTVAPIKVQGLFGKKWYYSGFCVAADCSVVTTSPDCPPRDSLVSGGGNASPCGGYWSKKTPCSF